MAGSSRSQGGNDTVGQPAPAGRWELARRLLSWSAALVMLVYAAWLYRSEGKGAEAIRGFPLVLLLLILPAAVIHNVAMGFRYLVILRGLGLRAGVRGWFRIFITGQIMNAFLGQSGNVYRTLALKRLYGFEYTKTIATYAAFGWMDTLLNALLAAAVIAVWDPGLELSGVNALAVVLVLLVGLLTAPFAIKALGRAGVSLAQDRENWWAKATRLSAAAVETVTRPRLVAAANGIGLVTFLLNLAMIHLAFQGLGVSPGVPVLVIFVCLLRLSGLVLITPDNLGIRELAYGFLAGAAGMDVSTGLIASGIIRVVTYVTLALLAPVVALLREDVPAGNGEAASGSNGTG